MAQLRRNYSAILRNYSDPPPPSEQARPQLVKQMVSVHNSQALATGGLNATGATPLMYHGFLKCWRGLFSSQRAKLSERVEHLNGGLSKLREATAEVDKLSKTANEQRAMLTVKQEEADRAMENIQKAMEAAVSNRSEVETLQKKLATEEVKMADRKKPSRDPTSHTPHSPICAGEDGRPQEAGGEGARRGAARPRGGARRGRRDQVGQPQRDQVSQDAARADPRRVRGRAPHHGQLRHLVDLDEALPRQPLGEGRDHQLRLAYAARRSGLRALRAQAPRAPCAQANEPRLRPRQFASSSRRSAWSRIAPPARRCAAAPPSSTCAAASRSSGGTRRSGSARCGATAPSRRIRQASWTDFLRAVSSA